MPPTDERLDSWKEIAAYLRRDVTTVQRWEKREGMPVHRHLHDRMGSVYALRSELDEWTRSRRQAVEEPTPPLAPPEKKISFTRANWAFVLVAAGVVVVAAAIVLWRLQARDAFWTNPIANAELVRLTDFEGTEQAAAVSRDGRFVAFLAERDGRMDVWMTQVGTGQFHNLTRNTAWELVNPSVRTLGFSPDGALVTFWTRKPGGSQEDIGIWAVPLLGGAPRPYLEGAAELDWSRDGSRLVFHTPDPGDPTYVREPGPREDLRLFVAPAGLHSHFPVWSPDGEFIYFVQGSPPSPMDVWRIPSAGGEPERITRHDSRVSHPVFVGGSTLLYLSSDASGGGPWLHGIDVDRRIPHRLSSGLDAFTSLSASADGRRLVATLATTKTTLWRVSKSGGAFDPSSATRIALSTGRGFSPRLGPGFLLYVSSKGASDGIWKHQADTATELWTAPDAKLIGGPAIDPDGRRVAFSVRQGDHASLYVMNSDGTEVRIVSRSLELQSAPAWTPNGQSISVSALEGGVPRLFNVPLDRGPPAPIGREHALDPAWADDGTLLVFSGTDVGTTFPVKAMKATGESHALPSLMLSRGSRHLRFLPGGRRLVVPRGEIRHKDLWAIDLDTGDEQLLVQLPPDFELRDFDISPDGSEIVLERSQAHSEIVLLDLPR